MVFHMEATEPTGLKEQLEPKYHWPGWSKQDGHQLKCLTSLTCCFSAVAADPVTGSQRSSERNAWCDDHNAIHKRLDNVQEQVEKTVDYLDSEVKSLLNDISETAWNVPLAPGTPLVDIFEGVCQI
ncbi:hypothetical protein lerEdw1_013445 [Lerista edwardsae]|nr:hypothetical protein lerEdw1_013447 [Lerista edwardsae]KAJ6650276.1 hypothetical protein lerEdw1_013445 [Lerista edwardsae]